MATQRREPRTTDDAMDWLFAWDDAAFISDGALPREPWRHATASDLESAANALMKVRAVFGHGRLGRGDGGQGR